MFCDPFYFLPAKCVLAACLVFPKLLRPPLASLAPDFSVGKSGAGHIFRNRGHVRAKRARHMRVERARHTFGKYKTGY